MYNLQIAALDLGRAEGSKFKTNTLIGLKVQLIKSCHLIIDSRDEF